MSVAKSCTFVVVASGSFSLEATVRVLKQYATVRVLQSIEGELPDSCIGIVTSAELARALPGDVPRMGLQVEAQGASNQSAAELERFAAYCIALHCCGSAAVAAELAKLELTPKQVALAALCCTSLGRRSVAMVSGVSKNTIKTRIRLLPQALGYSGIDALVSDILHKARVADRLPAPTHLSVRMEAGSLPIASWVEAIPQELLSLPLSRVRCPQEVAAFAVRERISTLGELLFHPSPPALLDARGPMRVAIRRLVKFGPQHLLAGCRDWSEVVEQFPPGLLSMPVADLPLSGALQRFARKHDVPLLGDVLRDPRLRVHHRTFSKTTAVLARLLEAPPRPRKPYDLRGTPSLQQAFRKRMEVLTPRERDVIEARSGLRKDVETLASAARRHNRSRQVALNDQKAAIKKMARDGFAAALEARLWTLLRGGVLALDDDRAKWLSADAPSEVLLQFVLSHFTTDPARTPCLVDVMGRWYLMPWSQTEFELQWEKAKARLARLTYPATRAQVRKAIEAGEHGKALGEPLMRCAREALLWGDQERQALAFGTDYAACVLAALRTCPTPISTQDLHERVGMGDLPAEVMRFAHGVVGLEQHFPDFVRYHKMLVPICVRKVRTEPEREWHSRELYGFLKSKVADLPAWMTFWHITELLRRAHSLRHLGWHSFTLAQRARAAAATRIQGDERGVAPQARD